MARDTQHRHMQQSKDLASGCSLHVSQGVLIKGVVLKGKWRLNNATGRELTWDHMSSILGIGTR